ncbi:MAG: hypothetical protein HFI03_09595 [Lachnospiraceae bacterium]|jgi:hypothetical protein|nr:hypothetical protein [Lachnospiraceae bacterium]
MMTYEELKAITERYGIGISQKNQQQGGFIDCCDGEVHKSILSDVQVNFGILTDEIGHKYYEIGSTIDWYAA